LNEEEVEHGLRVTAEMASYLFTSLYTDRTRHKIRPLGYRNMDVAQHAIAHAFHRLRNREKGCSKGRAGRASKG